MQLMEEVPKRCVSHLLGFTKANGHYSTLHSPPKTKHPSPLSEPHNLSFSTPSTLKHSHLWTRTKTKKALRNVEQVTNFSDAPTSTLQRLWLRPPNRLFPGPHFVTFSIFFHSASNFDLIHFSVLASLRFWKKRGGTSVMEPDP